jgi:hypothetical protein
MARSSTNSWRPSVTRAERACTPCTPPQEADRLLVERLERELGQPGPQDLPASALQDKHRQQLAATVATWAASVKGRALHLPQVVTLL